MSVQTLSNCEILCFVLGYQGGTVYQLAAELDEPANALLNAGYEEMQRLCRKAQKVRYGRKSNI